MINIVNNEHILIELEDVLETFVSGYIDRLPVYTKYNASISCFSSGDIEVLSALIYETLCTGSAGLGYDAQDNSEAKYCNIVQSKKCKVCEEKALFHTESCTCGCRTFKYPSDSRWGIVAKTAIKYITGISEYRMFLLEPKINHGSCKIYKLSHWVFDSYNKNFQVFAEWQHEAKGDNMNFLPYSTDFYYVSPVLRYQCEINIETGEVKTLYFDLENNESVKIPHNKIVNDYEIHVSNKKGGGESRNSERTSGVIDENTEKKEHKVKHGSKLF